jgi:acid phosphatase
MRYRLTKRTGVVVASALVALVAQGATRTPLPLPRNDVVPFSVAGVSRVVLVVLENGDPEAASRQPFMKYLADTGMVLRSYYAVAHPSQPNYVAMISGSTDGAMTDGNVRLPARKHLGNILPNGAWRVYAENYPALPGRCNLTREGAGADRLYVRRHVPFLSFADVQDSKCTEIVRLNSKMDDVGALKADIDNKRLAPFSMIIPNLEHDGHEPSNMKTASSWLMLHLKPLLQDRRFTEGLVLILTFDEDDSANASNGNRVFTVLWGDHVKIGMSTERSRGSPGNHLCAAGRRPPAIRRGGCPAVWRHLEVSCKERRLHGGRPLAGSLKMYRRAVARPVP